MAASGSLPMIRTVRGERKESKREAPGWGVGKREEDGWPARPEGCVCMVWDWALVDSLGFAFQVMNQVTMGPRFL